MRITVLGNNVTLYFETDEPYIDISLRIIPHNPTQENAENFEKYFSEHP